MYSIDTFYFIFLTDNTHGPSAILKNLSDIKYIT